MAKQGHSLEEESRVKSSLNADFPSDDDDEFFANLDMDQMISKPVTTLGVEFLKSNSDKSKEMDEDVKSCGEMSKTCHEVTGIQNSSTSTGQAKKDNRDGQGKKGKIQTNLTDMLSKKPKFISSVVEKSSVEPVKLPADSSLSLSLNLCQAVQNGMIPVVHREGFTKAEAERKYGDAYKTRLQFCDSFSDAMTHYVFDSNENLGLFKSRDFFLAMAKKIKIVHPLWLNEVLTAKDSAKVDEDPYMIYNVPMHKIRKSCFSASDPLFKGRTFIFPLSLTMSAFQFTREEMMKISACGGANVETSLPDLTKTSILSEEQLPKTFVVTTNIGTQTSLCIDLFCKLKVKTIHPQYILDCLLSNELLQVPVSQCFTPKILLKK